MSMATHTLWMAVATSALFLSCCAHTCNATSNTAVGGARSEPGADGSAASKCDWSTAYADFFAQDRVTSIRIDFDHPNAWESMLARKRAKEYHPATVTIDGESMSRVGVRLKGNSSLSMSQRSHTKSFKIHFEEYVKGQRFRCVDRLSLNNNFKDPSMMREHLAYTLASDLGLQAPRTAYAEVTVNGELHGVFTMVQQIDHRFLRERFGTENHADDGNLYKLYSHYDLSYLGPQAVARDYGDSVAERGLVLKTNEDDPARNDFADVTRLTKAIAGVLADPSAADRAALEAVFDVETYLRYQAWTLAISNLDTYYGPLHNLYLYHHPVNGKFIVLPWDTNEAFGAFRCRPPPPRPPSRSSRRSSRRPPPPPRPPPARPQAGDPPVESVYETDLLRPCGAELPLNRLSYQVPGYKARYCEILAELVDVTNSQSGGLYSVTGQDLRIASLHELIGEARGRMATQGVLSQPPGAYTFDDYLANQGHGASGPEPRIHRHSPRPGGGPNLGHFNDRRLASLVDLIAQTCH